MNINVEQWFELALECERKAHKAYCYFAGQFSDDQGAHAFWNALASDEKDHAEYILEISSNLTKSQKEEQLKYSMLYPVERLLEYVSNNPYTEIRNMEEAYQFTEKIEGFETTNIVQMLAQEYVSDQQRSDLLNQQLEIHYKLIEKYKKINTPSNKSL